MVAWLSEHVINDDVNAMMREGGQGLSPHCWHWQDHPHPHPRLRHTTQTEERRQRKTKAGHNARVEGAEEGGGQLLLLHVPGQAAPLHARGLLALCLLSIWYGCWTAVSRSVGGCGDGRG